MAEHYGSLPKGVILEGQATGFERIRSLSYHKMRHSFRLNRRDDYPLPLPRNEMAQVLRAIDEDDRMGVSIILGERNLTYGGLTEENPLSQWMYRADMFLISVVFGWEQHYAGVELPRDYQPLKPKVRRYETVCFSNFHDYVFARKNGVYRRIDCRLTLTLVPMGKGRAADGGYLPDYQALAKKRFEPTDLKNLRHVQRFNREYLNLPVVHRPSLVGEAAAFARTLKAEGFDLKAVARILE
jgi:hypothetical protein